MNNRIDPYEERILIVSQLILEKANADLKSFNFEIALEACSVNILEKRMGGKAWKDFGKDVSKIVKPELMRLKKNVNIT